MKKACRMQMCSITRRFIEKKYYLCNIMSDKSYIMEIKWQDGFIIKVCVDDESNVVISANKEGLLSLATQLEALANEDIGSHCHYDEYNSLEDGSSELIIEKIG